MQQNNLTTLQPVEDAEWSPSLFPRQQEAVQACFPSNQNLVLLNGPRWASKCVAPDTLVWTADGLRSIGSMGSSGEDLFCDINLEVLSMREGGFVGSAMATQFYNSGTKKALSISTDRGYSLLCSFNHPIWTECDGEIKYRTGEEIRSLTNNGKHVWAPLMREHPGDWAAEYQTCTFSWFRNHEARMFEASERVKKAKKAGAKTMAEFIVSAKAGFATIRKWLHTPKKKNVTSIKIDEEIGYLMGLMIGDGCCSKSSNTSRSVGFSSVDIEIYGALTNTIQSRFPFSHVRHVTGCDFRIESVPFREFLSVVGMADKYSYEKTIPPIILQSPKRVLIAFLQGLFDTDGTVCTKGLVSYCTTSIQLGIEVHVALLALGVRSTRRFHKNAFRGAWIISCQDEDNFRSKVGFRLTRKQIRPREVGKFSRVRSSYPPSIIDELLRLKNTKSSRGIGMLSRHFHRRILGNVTRGNTSLSKRRIVPIVDALNGWKDDRFQKYWMDGAVWWDRIKSCEQTESQLVDISVPETENFIGNGFINHNTFSCHHAVCNHAWNTDGGNICLLTITQGVGIDSGVWTHLTEIFLPEWINGNFGMEWVKKPWIQNTTKKPCCEVSNAYGNKTRISLESLRNEDEVEARFKGKAYSMIWINELSKFKKRKTFDTLKQQLRMPHLKEEQHLFLADTNPDLDLGVASWIYQLWYVFRTATIEQLQALFPGKDPNDFIPLQKKLKLIEFSVDDNLWLTEDKKAQLRSDFGYDDDLFAAYYHGKWVTASEDALFYRVFRPKYHCVGEIETRVNPEPETMVPEPNCFELILGMDPGPTNCAAAIMEKTFRKEGDREVPVIKVLDELVIVGEDFDLPDYIQELVEKMDFWERVIGRPGKTIWRQWSDRMVFDMKVPFSDRLWHQHIFQCSEGKISLVAAERGKGSVKARIDLFRKLLFEDRIFFSNTYCPGTIQMCKSIKRDKNFEDKIQKGSKDKHIFDAVTYAVSSELFDELNREIMMMIKSMRASKSNEQSSLVTVSL